VLEVALSNKIEPAGFVRAVVVAMLVGIGLTLLGWGIARDRWIGGLIASAFLVVAISIFPFYFAWAAIRDTFGPAVALAAIGIGFFLVIAVPAVQTARARRGAGLARGPITSALNGFTAALVAVIVVFHVGPDLPGSVADALRPEEKISMAPVADLPDIYIFLLDGYPRADVLQRKFGIDNAPFIRALEGLGFDVGTGNHSNYVFTQLTLASMFQMRHLEDVPGLAPVIGVPGGHVNALRNALIDSPALAALRMAGYEIVTIQPGYEHVALRGAADRVLEHGEMNDLERDVLKQTWLLDPLGALIPTLVTGPPRDRVVHAFDDVVKLPDESRTRRTFTWVHLPAPHLPLVMDAQGRTLPLDPRKDTNYADKFGMTDQEYADAYAAELSYLNGRVLGAVRALQQSRGHPDPVIVVMSDHGYTYDLPDTQARFANLFAAYTTQAPGLLAPAPTPVNLMPLLLDRFLGTSFPLSPDRYFLSPTIPELLKLTEVQDPN